MPVGKTRIISRHLFHPTNISGGVEVAKTNFNNGYIELNLHIFKTSKYAKVTHNISYSTTVIVLILTPLFTGGDNSNKRCLSNTRSQLKSSRKFGSSSRILGIHSRMSRFFSALSRNYRVFPGKISKCPDSRRNLQIPGTILALSRNSVC